MKIEIPFVEMMTTQVCNLSCRGCSTYSDIVHRGARPWQDAKQELVPWLDRVSFADFGVMGGEPLINPDIRNWITGARELMPDTKIRFPTNGLLLEKNFDIVDLLHQVGNSILKITVHVDDQNLESLIDRVFERHDWQPVVEFGIHRWKTSNDFVFQINRPQQFFMTFQGTYETAEPYNSNPAEAFAFCHQKLCPLLHNQRIYKCSTSGLMPGILEKHGKPNWNKWKPYVDHQFNGSIGLDSSDVEIQQFANNVGLPHSTCRQCPTVRTATTLEHKKNVIFRKNRIP